MSTPLDRSCIALFWALAVVTGLGPWLLPVAIAVAVPGKPLTLHVFTQTALAPRALAAAIAAAHGVVYVSLLFTLASSLLLVVRHGPAEAQRIVLRNLSVPTRARLALRVAAISSSFAFVVALLLLAIRWRAA
jgi:hypothetical protein